MALHLDEPALATAPSAEVADDDPQLGELANRLRPRGAAVASLGNTLSRITFPFSSISVDRQHDFLIGFGLSGSGASRHVGIDSAGVYPVEIGVIDAARRAQHVRHVDGRRRPERRPRRRHRCASRGSGTWGRAPSSAPTDPSTAPPSSPCARAVASTTSRRCSTARAASRSPSASDPQTLEAWAKEAHGASRDRERRVDRVRRAARALDGPVAPRAVRPDRRPDHRGRGARIAPARGVRRRVERGRQGHGADPRPAHRVRRPGRRRDRLPPHADARAAGSSCATRRSPPVPQPLTPAQPFSLTTTTGITSPAIATDSGLEQLVDSAGPPALPRPAGGRRARRDRVRSALASRAASCSRRRSDWSPDLADDHAAPRSDLAHDPLVKPATLDTMFSTVAPAELNGGPLQRQLAAVDGARAPPAARERVRRRGARSPGVRRDGRRRRPVGRRGASTRSCSRSRPRTPGPRRSRTSNTISAKLDALTSGHHHDREDTHAHRAPREPAAELPEQHRSRRASTCSCTSRARS